MHSFDQLGGRVSEQLAPYLDFRRNCGLVTYGDDSVIRVNRKRAPFYDPALIAGLGLERGMIYTDGGKLPEISWKRFDEIVFLKRQFRLIDGLLVAQLSLKSIVKMLVLAKDSTLTISDQTAALASDAIRELVYHGRDTFNEWTYMIMRAIEEVGLGDNPYFQCKDYDQFLDELRSGSFSAYKPVEIEVKNLCDEE
jgi:hypothetical protein